VGMSTVDQALIPVPEAAAALRVNPETLYRWVRAGRIPAYGAHGCMRVSLAEIRAVPYVKARYRGREWLRGVRPGRSRSAGLDAAELPDAGQ
jgi:excisionase family DNA binding protein